MKTTSVAKEGAQFIAVLAITAIISWFLGWTPAPTLSYAVFKAIPLFLLGGLVVIAVLIVLSKTVCETAEETGEASKEVSDGFGSN